MASEIDEAKYVSFVSYKRDGSTVATPVWVVPFDGGYAFTTEPSSFKVRRIRNDARIIVSACDMRGKVNVNATQYHGAAVVLSDEDARRVVELINKKYWIGTKLLGVISLAKKLTGKGGTAGDAAIKFTLNS